MNRFAGGAYLHMPDASKNKRGRARTELVRHVAKTFNRADLYVFLDDDTRPEPGYFRFLEQMALPQFPAVFGGKLGNADGARPWAICSFSGKDPVVVPYLFWDSPDWAAKLYLSGPQHIFNRAGIDLAARLGYPDVEYGEDTGFCHSFTANLGRIVFIPDIAARLAHQHNPPNEAMWPMTT